MMWFTRVLFAIVFFTCSFAEEVKSNSDRSDYKRSLVKECDKGLSVTCLKLNMLEWMDKFNENKSWSILPGVSVVRENTSAITNNAQVVADLAREFPNDPNARLDSFLLNKLQRFLNSYSLKVNLGAEPGGENVDEARKKKRRGGGDGGMGMMLAAAGMMKSMLFTIAMGALAALAGKALMTSMVALVLSAIIGLKSLTSGSNSKTTYEVVAKPSHDDSSHWSGSGRSFDMMPLPLGLQPGYKPA